MSLRAVVSALIVAVVLTFSGCSAPPIAADVAQELQAEVQQIAVLAARGDTADAVAAAHALSGRVRTAQAEGKITGERAVTILQRTEQLIHRLVRSGAAPAATDLPQPVAGRLRPAAPPSDKPEPTETADPDQADGQKAGDAGTSDGPAAVAPQAAPDPAVPEPVEVPVEVPVVDPLGDGSSGGSGSSGSSGGSSNSGPEAAPVFVNPDDFDDFDDSDDDVDSVDDAGDADDGGKGRGRGRSSDE